MTRPEQEHNANWLAAYTKARHETLVARQLTSKLVSHLLPTYPWPGNIREMRNILEAVAQVAQRSPLTVSDLELQHASNETESCLSAPSASVIDTRLTMHPMETRFIEIWRKRRALSIAPPNGWLGARSIARGKEMGGAAFGEMR